MSILWNNLRILLVCLSILSLSNTLANTALQQIGQLSLSIDKTYQVDGQYLYAASCGGFETFDLVDPLKPNLLANFALVPTGDCSFKLALNHSYAYVVTWQGIDIIDITTPNKPKRAGNYELPQANSIADFMVIGNYGYIIYGNSISVLDLTNPTQPVFAGSKTFASNNNSSAIKVRTNGEQLIVRKNTILENLSTDELFIFNLKNPAKFEQISLLSLEGRTTSGITRYYPDEFKANGQYLYVESLGNILTIDISNPANPQQIGKYTFSDDSSFSINNIVIDGNFLYYLRHNTSQEMSAQDATHKVFTLEISNPRKLTLVGTYKLDRNNYNFLGNIYLYKQYLRVNNLILDISQPSQIKVVDTFNNTFINSLSNFLVAKDKFVYLTIANSLGGTLLIVDVSDPTFPNSLSSITFNEIPFYPLNRNTIPLTIDNNTAYLCNKLGVYTVDVSNPYQPKKIGQYLLSTNERCEDIGISGKYIYLIASKDYSGENKIITLDISNPKELAKIGEYQSPNRRWNKFISNGEQLYVSAQTTQMVNNTTSNYLHIFNISNPTMLQELSSYEMPSYGFEIALVGQYIYITTHSNIHIVDVSNPSSPKLLGNYSNNSLRSYEGLRSVQTGHNLYLSDYFSLSKIDVSNPAKPKPIAQIMPSSNFTYALAANEPYIYRLSHSFQVFKSVEVEAPQMTQIKGLANGTCDLNLSAKMLNADDGTGKNIGDFYLHWKETGRESTLSGDAVIAGYFYAPSEKVTWGSEANPEVYAKLWFSVNGMLNVNFFHVGVFDVQLDSSYGVEMPQLNGGSDLDHNKMTIGRKAWRYSRHDYTNWRICGSGNTALGNLKVDSTTHNTLKNPINNKTKLTTSVFKSPTNSAAKISINQQGSCELLMDAKMLNATSNGKPYGNLKLQWKEISRSTTTGGDTVIAGYFYGSPNEVSWGSATNPEAYVKIWFSRSGLLNVNFFHVGVFDIELTSSYKGLVADGIDGVLNDDNNFINIWGDANRYARHDYNNWRLCN
ncbi:MAG: hypothetical protein RIT27_1061 [Pseudomonadota bacterium]|jgi:hypothetical protein